MAGIVPIVIDVRPHALRTDEHPAYIEGEWLFVEGDQIVGRVKADCDVCAWRKGHLEFPLAQMYCKVSPNSDDDEECIHSYNRRVSERWAKWFKKRKEE